LNFPLFVARRYFAAPKSRHATGVISRVAMAGIATGTAGLVIVLSVFNGFSDLITGLYDAFDPDLRITARAGKGFEPGDLPARLRQVKGVAWVCETLEENALARYRDRQALAVVKGVDENFVRTSRISDYMVDGPYRLMENGRPQAVVGSGLAYSLGVNPDDRFSLLSLYVPKKGTGPVLAPEQAFTQMVLRPAGVFAIQQDFDARYLIVPLAFARGLVDEPVRLSALEVALAENADAAAVQKDVAEAAGPAFRVLDRIAQHDFLNRVFVSEKRAIYIILGFILLIAAFSIVGSVTTLAIEKKQDLATLAALGATWPSIRRIYIAQGTLICLAGGIAGIAWGGLLAWAQQAFGWIKIGNGQAFLIDAYPVAIQAMDFVWSLLLVFGIGILLSWLTAGKAVRPGKVAPGAAV
jgi:lipoprotein-releasing system permease protein